MELARASGWTVLQTRRRGPAPPPRDGTGGADPGSPTKTVRVAAKHSACKEPRVRERRPGGEDQPPPPPPPPPLDGAADHPNVRREGRLLHEGKGRESGSKWEVLTEQCQGPRGSHWEVLTEQCQGLQTKNKHAFGLVFCSLFGRYPTSTPIW